MCFIRAWFRAFVAQCSCSLSACPRVVLHLAVSKSLVLFDLLGASGYLGFLVTAFVCCKVLTLYLAPMICFSHSSGV
jgi:hypothetical protein